MAFDPYDPKSFPWSYLSKQRVKRKGRRKGVVCNKLSSSLGLLNEETEAVVERWGGRWSKEHACNHVEST
jgi:hypothetical protein